MLIHRNHNLEQTSFKRQEGKKFSQTEIPFMVMPVNNIIHYVMCYLCRTSEIRGGIDREGRQNW